MGAPKRCPLNLSRSVSAPTVTGASINEEARALIENALSLRQDAPSPRPDPHSRRADGRSSEIGAAPPVIERCALVIGKPTLVPERASVRIEPSSLRLTPSSLLKRSRACHPERRARSCGWRSAIVRHPRVARDLLFSYLGHPRVAKGARAASLTYHFFAKERAQPVIPRVARDLPSTARDLLLGSRASQTADPSRLRRSG